MGDSFSLEGFFEGNNGKVDFNGEMEFMTPISFKGKFDKSPIESNIPQEFMGRIMSEDSSSRIIFFQYPLLPYSSDLQVKGLSSLFYEFYKKSDGLFEGNYTGKISDPPVKVNPSSKYVLDEFQDYLLCKHLWWWHKGEINIKKK